MPNFAITASTDLTTKPKRLMHWSFSSTVAAGVINLRDGGVAGTIFARVNVAIGDSKHLALTTPGVVFPSGLYVEVTAGTVVGGVTLE